MRIVLVVSLILFLTVNCFGLQRCKSYSQKVREQTFYYMGFNYPYWYNIGQLEQESACRTDITARDGGQGIAQFMPSTFNYISSMMHQKLNPYNPTDAIKAQVFYLSKLQKQNHYGGLWLTYQAYNGGWGWLIKEYRKAGVADWQKMKNACVRTKVNCAINYQYSKKVFIYGQTYREFKDRMEYWDADKRELRSTNSTIGKDKGHPTGKGVWGITGENQTVEDEKGNSKGRAEGKETKGSETEERKKTPQESSTQENLLCLQCHQIRSIGMGR